MTDHAEREAAQVALWNGPGGQAWATIQETMDAHLGPITERLLDAAALRPGERVLDVGCGCGDTTLRAAARVGPAGTAVGVDISAPMLERAEARGAGAPRVAWRLANAATAVHPEAPFDALISRFGVMFFADPAGAFAHLATQLRPGGRVAFVCWRAMEQCELITFPVRAAAPHLEMPPPPGPDEPGPASFADPDRVRAILEAAGLAEVEITARDASLVVGRDVDEALYLGRHVGPLARALGAAPPEAANRALAALREAFEALAARGPLELGAAWWEVRATRP